MTRAQGKHREFSLNQSVATLLIDTWFKIENSFIFGHLNTIFETIISFSSNF